LAIALEFVNVIARKSAVEAKYAGGLDAFARQELANYMEDEHLLRVGFMSTSEAFAFVGELQAAGLRYSEDMAVITGDTSEVPSWLTVEECEGRGACWLSGQPAGGLIDFETGMLLRCRSFATVAEIVRVLCGNGAEVRERVVAAEGRDSVVLDCGRGDARIEVEVFTDPTSGRLTGVWARRDLTRRTSMGIDVALLRDVESLLVSAGAEDSSDVPWDPEKGTARDP
jgi:hypothetical protein